MQEEKSIRINVRGVVNLRLAELNAFQEDIKVLTDENYARMKEEILADGFSFSPHVFLDGEGRAWLLDGHQRRTCLLRMEGEGYAVPSIPCMEVEAESLEHARRLVLAAASQYGTFKIKKLVDFTKRLGLEPAKTIDRFVLPVIGFEKIITVNAHARQLGAPGESETYTKKIKSPIYEPKGEQPEVRELFDDSKTIELSQKILAANLPDDVRDFLLFAADRHVVFNYEKIAEYYAHASADVQGLMEESALVIIDFNKAIENGFVHMSEELARSYSNE